MTDARRYLVRSYARQSVGVMGNVFYFNHALASVATFLLAMVCLGASALAGETYAVLVGIDQYDNFRPAKYAGRDAQTLASTLADRGNVPESNLLLLHDQAQGESRPTRANIVGRTTAFVQKPKADDRLIVFFSGHGLRDESGRTYLAPIDFQIDKPQASGIEISWLRRVLGDCRAKTKLLILDACHAGNTRGEVASDGVTSRDVEKAFAEADGIHTLASCQAEEVSWSDDARRQGLFSYWLNLGLQGAADRDGDGQITGFELFEFVDEPVRMASRNRFGRQQTPGQIVGPRVGRSPVLQLTSENWSQTLPRVADLLHEQILDRRYQRVGVTEFSSNLGGRTTLGEIGIFGRFAADAVQKRLRENAAADDDLAYTVVDREEIEKALAGLGATALANTKAIERVRTSTAKPAAIVDGTFQVLNDPARLRLQCRLISVDTGNTLGLATGIIGLDADLLAVMGVSWSPQHTAAEPDESTPAEELHTFLQPEAPEELFRWENDGDAHVNMVHPLLKDGFAYKLRFLARAGDDAPYRELPLLKKEGEPNKVYLPARGGDQYLMIVDNPTKQDTLVRTYIDGFNTLGKTLEPEMGSAAYLIRGGNTNRIENWALVVGQEGDKITTENRRFVFVEPAKSVAAAHGYQGGLGQITLVFSEARPMGWVNKLGTGEDVKKTLKTFEEVNVCEGRLLHTVTIHYLDESALRE